MIEKSIKIILAALFFVCLAKMPYGYYQLVRFIAMIGFAYLSYKNFEEGNKLLSFIFAALAILFQPLLKIDLGRTIWNIVDVVVGTGLIFSLFLKSKKAFQSKK